MHKYRYDMLVTETTETLVTLESERRLTFEELRKRTEARRLDGTTRTQRTVVEVDISCLAAFCDGTADDGAIAR